LDRVRVLDAPGARRSIADLIKIIRAPEAKGSELDTKKRDARIALDLIQQIDQAHPETVLIESRNWQGDMDQIKKNVRNLLKTKNYDDVAKLVPQIIILVENNEDLYTRVKSAEVLAEISDQHPLLLERYLPRFFRLIFDDSLDVGQYVAEILYNIDFHSFDSHSPEKLRKILLERFRENLVNTFTQVDYSRHFLKYGISIENFTKTWIWNVLVTVKPDPGFTLVKVDPDVPMKFDRIRNLWTIDLNAIQFRSSKKFHLFLEPAESPVFTIQATLSYKTTEGKPFSKDLPPETIDLYALAPRFMTNVNFGEAHCKEFFEFKAKVKDNRKFSIADSVNLGSFTTSVMNAINAESIITVREYKVDKIKDQSDFFSEMYFHGQTRINRDEVAIVVRIDGEDRTFVFMIAANVPANIVGLYNRILSKISKVNGEKVIEELKCPRCLEPIDPGATFCPWCSFQLGKQS
jgi:hypothetical protein